LCRHICVSLPPCLGSSRSNCYTALLPSTVATHQFQRSGLTNFASSLLVGVSPSALPPLGLYHHRLLKIIKTPPSSPGHCQLQPAVYGRVLRPGLEKQPE